MGCAAATEQVEWSRWTTILTTMPMNMITATITPVAITPKTTVMGIATGATATPDTFTPL
jgi:hypothetical protein